MKQKNDSTDEIASNISIFKTILTYYVIIGIGLGLLGAILMNRFGGGEGLGGAAITGFLSIVIISFAILVGPIISAFMGHIASLRNSSAITSGISTGIGAVVLTVIVISLLVVSIGMVVGGSGGGASSQSISSGGGSSIQISENIGLILAVFIPNALVGAGITYFSDNKALNSLSLRQAVGNINYGQSSTNSGSKYMIAVLSILFILILLLVAGPTLPTFSSITGNPDVQIRDASVDKSSASVDANAIIENNGQNSRTVEIKIQVIINSEVVSSYSTERQLSADSTERVASIIFVRESEMTSYQTNAYENNDFEVEFLIDGQTRTSATQFTS